MSYQEALIRAIRENTEANYLLRTEVIELQRKLNQTILSMRIDRGNHEPRKTKHEEKNKHARN
jgi:hypothetical protein